jgi:TatA/E family protein of Tat protein translocase
MFGSIGGPELLLLLVLALLLFGPRRLPQIGRSFGRALAEFRGAANEFRAGLERDVETERRKELPEANRSVAREPAVASDAAARVESAADAAPAPPGHESRAAQP